ncbi:hypothetical protein ACH0B6_07340 [Solibacillus silvestris]
MRLLEEMWLLLGNTMGLLNSESGGLKKNLRDIHIRTLLCDIRKNIRIFENPAAILEKSKPLFEYRNDILENRQFIRR